MTLERPAHLAAYINTLCYNHFLLNFRKLEEIMIKSFIVLLFTLLVWASEGRSQELVQDYSDIRIKNDAILVSAGLIVTTADKSGKKLYGKRMLRKAIEDTSAVKAVINEYQYPKRAVVNAYSSSLLGAGSAGLQDIDQRVLRDLIFDEKIDRYFDGAQGQRQITELLEAKKTHMRLEENFNSVFSGRELSQDKSLIVQREKLLGQLNNSYIDLQKKEQALKKYFESLYYRGHGKIFTFKWIKATGPLMLAIGIADLGHYVIETDMGSEITPEANTPFWIDFKESISDLINE